MAGVEKSQGMVVEEEERAMVEGLMVMVEGEVVYYHHHHRRDQSQATGQPGNTARRRGPSSPRAHHKVRRNIQDSSHARHTHTHIRAQTHKHNSHGCKQQLYFFMIHKMSIYLIEMNLLI